MEKGIWFAAALAALLPAAAQAQSAQELVNGKNDTHDVVNYGMGYDLQRYSPLTQIDKKSVKQLVPAWNYSLDDNRSEESQPFVYKGIIYLSTWKATMAIDARTGRQVWKTAIEIPPEAPRIVCCGLNNRGVALYDGKVFRGTVDATIMALDAKTGKQLWKQTIIDYKLGYAMTGAPLVADGVLITGISGAEYGTRDFLDGWDPATGKHLWRTYTIPGPGEKGHDSWAGDTWQHGGGSTWVTGSYDPELHSVYWGTGNPGPWGPAIRTGDNLFTSSVLALDPKTGTIKWYYQFTPHDGFDYDGVNEMVLATIKVHGHPTRVILHADRNGFFYVIDRTDGKLIAANAFARQNWAKGIDMKTGRPILSDVTLAYQKGEEVEVWPAITGGKNWDPMSFNPKTGLVYANTLEVPATMKQAAPQYRQGVPYFAVQIGPPKHAAPNRGHLKAIDPLTGKAKWDVPSLIPRFSGTLTTAGGLVFAGELTGAFEAFDADTGKKLWQFQTGSGVEGQPVTFEEDGVQYVLVTSGNGGVYTLHGGDERMGAVPAGGSLWAFALLDKQQGEKKEAANQ